jgi:hypothetical protein
MEKRPDPVREVCDIQVKIADLGNACWVVSSLFYSKYFKSPLVVVWSLRVRGTEVEKI